MTETRKAPPPELEPQAGEVLRLLPHDLPDAEWPRLAGDLAELHQYVRERGRQLAEAREAFKELKDQLEGDQAAALAKMDPLADKVQKRRYDAYVLCVVVSRDEAAGTQILRRTDTGEEFEEPIPTDEAGQQALVDTPPAPPKGKGKLCNCPGDPAQAMRGETWGCPEHGHMWRPVIPDEAVVEPYPWT